MKHASLLIALCLLFGLASIAQTTTTVEKSTKRITITTKKVDENGKTVTETYIAEGDEPVKILEGMAINPEIIQRVEVENPSMDESGERLFLFRSAGEGLTIEGKLDESGGENLEKVIIIDKAEGKDGKECYKVIARHGGPKAWAIGHDSKINCAALGVYVNNDFESTACRVSSLIDNGGAQAAGMQAGDIITSIDRYDVNDYQTLHEALSHFRPGDVVTVRFEREGKSKKVKAELKDWKDLPGHEWRSRTDCGNDSAIVEPEKEEIIETAPVIASKLELQEVSIFPNPTENTVAVSFRAEPGPLTVAITDVSGKVVYQESNENPGGLYNREIDLRELMPGNYVFSVTQGDKVYTEQISKQ